MTARPTPRVLPVDAVLLAALEQEEQAQARLLAIPKAAAAFGVKVRGMLDIPARQGAALAAIGDHPEAAEIRRLVVAAAHGRWRAAHQYRDLARAASVRWCKGRPDLDHNEVTASATEGLYQAAVRWRPSQGATFATYGRWWLRARLYREFPEIQGMHIPGHLAERLRYARRLADQGLSDAEICERLDLSPELLTAGRVAQQPSLSLDHLPTDDGDEGHLHAVVASTGPTPEELAEEAQRFDQLRAALAQLPDREREIIEARFGLCGEQLTLTEVGKRLGRSRERMRQIERHALTTLRDLLTTTPVPPSPLEALVAPIDRLVQIVTDNPGITQHEAAMAMGVGDNLVFALVQGYPDRVVKRTEGKRARLYLPTPSSASPGVVVPTSGVGLPVSGAEDRAQVAALGAVTGPSAEERDIGDWWANLRIEDGKVYRIAAEDLPEDLPEDRAQVAALGAVEGAWSPANEMERVTAHRDALARELDVERFRHGNTMGKMEELRAQLDAERLEAESDHLAADKPPPGWEWTGTAWARTGDQPAPSGGVGDVWGEIIAILPEGSRARAMAVDRRQVGIDRYGVPLGRGDGRDEERDEREELMDAAGYRQRRIGRPGVLAQGVEELLAMAVESDAWWTEYHEAADRDLDQAHEVSRILADADIGPGPYVERIRELAARATWTDREVNVWRAVMRAVDPTVGAVIAALTGVTP